MLQVNNCFLFLVILMLLNHTVRPWEFSPVEDNVIIKTDAIIRFIVHQMVEIFGVASKTSQLIERYMRVHNQLVGGALAAAANWLELRRHATADVDASMTDQIENLLHHPTDQSTHQSTNRDLLIALVDNFLKHVEANKNIHGEDMNIDAYLQNELILNYGDSDEIFANAFDESSENETDDDEFWTPKNISFDTRRIFGSLPTTIRRFPFMASITMFEQFHCAGVIIASDLVITAASGVQLAYNNRFYRENPTFLSVRVGSTYHEMGGETIAVSEIFFHPSYNPKTLRNNICVLRLVRHIRFRNKLSRNKRVKKIDFDKRDSPLPNNTPEVLILGWGAKNTANKIGMEGILRLSRLNVYSPRDCQDIYSKEFVTIHHFCAGFVSKGGGACNQDVGDPGIINGLLHGIVSFGAPVCGAPDSPTVFTKIGFYADWIETIMEQKAPTGRKRTTTTTEFPIILENKKRQYNQNSLTLSSFDKILPLVIREYTTKQILNANLSGANTITVQDSETTTDDFHTGRTVDSDNENDMPAFVKKQIKKTTTTMESSDSYDSLQSTQDDDYTTKKKNSLTIKHNKNKHKVKKYKHTTQKTTTIDKDVQETKATEKYIHNKPSKFYYHDEPTSEDYEHDNIETKKKKQHRKKHKQREENIHNVHNEYGSNIDVTPEFHELNRETAHNTSPNQKKKKLINPIVHIDKNLNEIHLYQQKTTKKDRIHHKLLYNIRDLIGSKKVHLDKKYAPYSFNQEEVTPFNNNFTPEEEKSNHHTTEDVGYLEIQTPLKTSKEIYSEKQKQKEAFDYNGDEEDGSRIYELQTHEQVKNLHNMPIKHDDEDKYVSAKFKKIHHVPSKSVNSNRDLQMYAEYQETENEDYQLKIENDASEKSKDYNHKISGIPDFNEYDSEEDSYHLPVTPEKSLHTYHQKQHQQKRPNKINDFGKHEIIAQNQHIIKLKTTKAKRPKDLGQLNSHELKQMFLEQISKQNNAEFQKQHTTLANTNNQDQDFVNNVQVKFTDLETENNKKFHSEGGIYDFLKSAFNKIQNL